jgi:hypothetical protein
MNRRIYVAGPMRDNEEHKYENHNHAAFDAAERRLIEAGWSVVSPATLNRAMQIDPNEWPDDPNHVMLLSVILQDLLVLTTVDAIFMMQDWEHSKGAKLEKAMAEFLGKRVYYEYPPDENPADTDVEIHSNTNLAPDPLYTRMYKARTT